MIMFIAVCLPLSFYLPHLLFTCHFYIHIWQFKNIFISLILFPSKCRAPFLLPCIWATCSELLLPNRTWQLFSPEQAIHEKDQGEGCKTLYDLVSEVTHHTLEYSFLNSSRCSGKNKLLVYWMYLKGVRE